MNEEVGHMAIGGSPSNDPNLSFNQQLAGALDESQEVPLV
jgi:hypothetical protein